MHIFTTNITYRFAVAAVLFLLGGCAEGNFEIADTSRLPKWFHLPSGVGRADVSVTMDTYIVPTEKDVFTLRRKNGPTIAVVTAHRLGGYLEPKQLRSPPPAFPAGYPSYEVLTSGVIVDIIEHRRMEPIFYTTDDASVWRELGPQGGG